MLQLALHISILCHTSQSLDLCDTQMSNILISRVLSQYGESAIKCRILSPEPYVCITRGLTDTQIIHWCQSENSMTQILQFLELKDTTLRVWAWGKSNGCIWMVKSPCYLRAWFLQLLCPMRASIHHEIPTLPFAFTTSTIHTVPHTPAHTNDY